MERKVLNLESKRQLTINGQQYNKLIKNGYQIDKDGNLYLPKLKSPIYKVMETNIMNKILSTLEPKDLLALYLTDKKSHTILNTSSILTDLSLKYNTPVFTTFLDFIKYYNKQFVNKELLYLYDLENTIPRPSPTFVDDFVNTKKLITPKMRAILIDWLYQVNKMFKRNVFILGLAVTYLDYYLNIHDIPKEKLQLLGICSWSLAEFMLYEYIEETSDFIYISEGAYTNEEIVEMEIDLFKTLNGLLVRPSQIFFVPKDNIMMQNLALISYFTPELMVYKPSIIAESIQFLITGQYHIYLPSEIAKPCTLITTLVNRAKKSNLTSLKTLINTISLNHTCAKEQKLFITQDIKVPEEWHIGEYAKMDVVGVGVSGAVYKIKAKETYYVLKKIKINNEDNMQSAMIELTSLKQLKNNYIIHLSNYDLNKNKATFYLPYMQSNLKTFIPKNKITKKLLLKYMQDITKGVSVCHYNDIIHRDLKPDNIVFNGNQMLLIDFGLAVPLTYFRIDLLPHMAATINYRAPEALLGDTHYTKKIDIWALGCIFYFMVTKEELFTGYDMLISIFKLFGTPTEQTWPGVTKLPDWNENYNNYKLNTKDLKKKLGKFYDLIMPCFVLNPKERIDANQLLENINKAL